MKISHTNTHVHALSGIIYHYVRMKGIVAIKRALIGLLSLANSIPIYAYKCGRLGV